MSDRFREHRVRTSLQRVAPSSSNAEELRDKARELWRRFGIVVVWPDQHVPWADRAMIENTATRLYGDKVKR